MQNTVAISTGPSTHLDHLGVLSLLLNVPLIVTEETTYRLAKKFYPDLQVFLKNPADLSIDFLAQFDRIFQCGQFWAVELLPMIELFHRKRVRILFCPHGNSDKGHSASQLPPQDIALVYGNQMAEHLKQKGAVCKEMVSTGNYRFPFYRKKQNFYDTCAEEAVFSGLDSRRRTLLYAPSWNDGENLSSFFSTAGKTIEQLTKRFNLIVKLHPLLEEEYPAETEYLLSHYEKSSHLLILQEFPPIYPLLARASAYIGDFSSIGYDFLAFDRPLFFLNPSKESLHLHKCGMTIPPEEDMCAFIESKWNENQNKFSLIRRKTYQHAFGEERTPSNLRNEILSKS